MTCALARRNFSASLSNNPTSALGAVVVTRVFRRGDLFVLKKTLASEEESYNKPGRD